MDATVVGFALGVSLATSLIFGLLPALQATGRSLTQAWREGDRGGGAGRAGHRVRAALVVAEMALAVMLLIGAGLLIRSFAAMTRVPNGFQADRLLTFRMSLQGPAYPDGAAIRRRVAGAGAASARPARRDVAWRSPRCCRSAAAAA